MSGVFSLLPVDAPAVSAGVNSLPRYAPEFVSLRDWMQEREDLRTLLSCYAPGRFQEPLLGHLARVLRTLETGGASR
jgi:hypothetical protein